MDGSPDAPRYERMSIVLQRRARPTGRHRRWRDGECGVEVGDAAVRRAAKTRGRAGNVTAMNYALPMRRLALVTLVLVGAPATSRGAATESARHVHEHGKAARRLTPLH